ncbi:MAG TPA: DUF2306 domain-containing protein [Cellvibrionaceae bacterium]|nr:DUF2306 domain-containing protein [Cellvibrionaceae bacterium]HMW72054.1 DUF2306 domain-containing protein [Cellvibrionaceae bacterium]HNG59635.1 DUF2306 domain-containing protein [Cellvibrionaceae bacterium]
MSQKLLNLSSRLWFVTAAAGQLAFVLFIVTYYGSRTWRGDFAAWNNKPVITGFVPGDSLGNLLFALHVLLGGVITLAGLLQLVPRIRQAAPGLHRWNGRLFLALAVFLALDGVWKILVRGSTLSTASTLSGLVGAALILLCCALAFYFARRGQVVKHRRWALRAFLVVSGVWFFRVGIMAWVILNQGPRGMNATLSGPADVALAIGSYCVPLAGLQMYLWAQSSAAAGVKNLVSLLIVLLTGLMAVGIVGTVSMMWWPYL